MNYCESCQQLEPDTVEKDGVTECAECAEALEFQNDYDRRDALAKLNKLLPEETE